MTGDGGGCRWESTDRYGSVPGVGTSGSSGVVDGTDEGSCYPRSCRGRVRTCSSGDPDSPVDGTMSFSPSVSTLVRDPRPGRLYHLPVYLVFYPPTY